MGRVLFSEGRWGSARISRLAVARLAFDRLGRFFRSPRRRLTRAPDMVAGLTKMRDRLDAEQQIDSAILSLSRAAAEALDVFKSAGLPDRLGTYAVMTDESYVPIEVRQTPNDKLVHVNDVPAQAVGVMSLWGLGQREHAPDSPIGFAARVIEIVEGLRDRLRDAAERGSYEEVRSINEALLLREASLALWLEFVEGPDIASSRARREVQQEGGRARGGQVSGEAKVRHEVWQSAADEIWARKPELTKQAVARAIQALLAASEHPGALNTIRSIIVKKT